MKKILVVLRILFVVLTFGVVFSGCKNHVEEQKEYYTVTFNSKGGSEVPSQVIEKNKTAVEPKDPSKDSTDTTTYIFEAWYTSIDNGLTLSSTKFNFVTPITADITLYAKWKELIKKTNTEEEEEPINNKTNTEEEEEPINNKTEIKSNQTSDANSSTAVESDNQNDEIKEHEHTYSSSWSYDEVQHWHQATCEHTDEISDLAEHIYDDGELTTKPTTEKNGLFTYTCKICGSQKKYLVGKLQKHSFYLTGSSTKEIKSGSKILGVVYSYNYKCSNCDVSCTKHESGRRGCTVGQWAVMGEGLSVQDSLDNIDFNKKSNEVCSAYSDSIILQGEIFTISYILNGGTNNAENPIQYTKGTSITLKDPVKTGEVFYGWYEDAYFSGNRIYTIDSTSASNKTFYAKWQIDSYTITFDTQGGSAVVPQVVASNEHTVKPQNPTKENFDFVYWYYYDSYNQIIEYNFGNYLSQDISLYAKWNAKPVSVPISVSVLPESDIEVIKTQTENGYSFFAPGEYDVLGWYWDNVLTSSSTTISIGSDKLTKGTHVLSLEAKSGNRYRSYTAEITVE